MHPRGGPRLHAAPLAPELANELTGKANRVAIVTDGSAVLGLGNLGPLAALPVMEGKAATLRGTGRDRGGPHHWQRPSPKPTS